MTDNKNIDDFIRSALENQKITPPPRLKQELHRQVFWRKFVSFSFVSPQNIATVLTSILLLTAISWQFFPSEKFSQPIEQTIQKPVDVNFTDSSGFPEENNDNIPDNQEDDSDVSNSIHKDENPSLANQNTNETPKAVLESSNKAASPAKQTDLQYADKQAAEKDADMDVAAVENNIPAAVASAVAVAQTEQKPELQVNDELVALADNNKKVSPTSISDSKLPNDNSTITKKVMVNSLPIRLPALPAFIPEKPKYQLANADYVPVIDFKNYQEQQAKYDKMRDKLEKQKKRSQRKAKSNNSYMLEGEMPQVANNEKNKGIEIGLGFMPLRMYNTSDGEDQMAYNTDVFVRYHFGQYFLQSGLGFTYNDAQTNWNVGMHDYLGSYNDLDSISFVINPVTQEVEPVYHTSETNVNDTAVLTIEESTGTAYTYFSVPLLAGYTFNTNGRFGFLMKTGFIMALQVQKNVSNYINPDQRDIVLSVDKKSPGRYTTQWQYSFGVAANYRFSERFSFELEPEMRYYLRTAYENAAVGEDKKPYALGLRFGILFKL